jgi:hypothetical protein
VLFFPFNIWNTPLSTPSNFQCVSQQQILPR